MMTSYMPNIQDMQMRDHLDKKINNLFRKKRSIVRHKSSRSRPLEESEDAGLKLAEELAS